MPTYSRRRASQKKWRLLGRSQRLSYDATTSLLEYLQSGKVIGAKRDLSTLRYPHQYSGSIFLPHVIPPPILRMDDTKIQQFVLLAKGARGRGLCDLISKATAEPLVYTFGELMEVPTISDVSDQLMRHQILDCVMSMSMALCHTAMNPPARGIEASRNA